MKLQLYIKDCLAGMAKMKVGSVDLIVTSPPYNLGIKYKSYDDNIPRSEYLKWMTEWGKAVSNILTDDGSLFLNMGARPVDPTIPFQVLNCLTESSNHSTPSGAFTSSSGAFQLPM